MKKTVINVFQKKLSSKTTFLVLLFLLFFIATNNILAQGLSGTCWQNSFGSTARITSHNLITGEFRGTYGSSTGSSGIYTIIGKTPIDSDLNSSFPLTFTIGWGTISGIPDDNSQYWTSSMSGYYNGGTKKTLNLLNIISAPGPFEEVKIFEPGNLPQTQFFSFIPIENCESIKIDPPTIPSGDGNTTDLEYAYLLLGNWNIVLDYSTGEITKMVIENLLPRGENFPNLRYFEVTGHFYLTGVENPVSFTGIVGPHIPTGNNDFSYAMSVVGSYLDSTANSHNISLSGFSDGNGTKTIKMFLLKSQENGVYRIDANSISSGELFQKN
jgi:hypothetical protein